MSDENFRAECGDCRFCQDNGVEPQDVSKRIYNCHVNPPAAVPMGAQGGSVAVMTYRPTVKETDTACEKMKPAILT
jgi:hypothetical protein